MKTNSKGFTLMELMIVVFLITVILGLSAFFFTGFRPAAEFNSTGREILSTIHRTRSLARTSMERQTFMINLDNRSYGMEGAPAKNIPPGISIKVVDPLSGEITHGQYSIVFNSAGAMAFGTIILSQKGRIFQIELDPVTGAISTRDKS